MLGYEKEEGLQKSKESKKNSNVRHSMMNDVDGGDTDEFAISCESARADSARRRRTKGFIGQDNAFRNT